MQSQQDRRKGLSLQINHASKQIRKLSLVSPDVQPLCSYIDLMETYTTINQLYQKLATVCQKLIQQKHQIDAHYQLGNLHYHGFGNLMRNVVEGNNYYTTAASLGHPLAKIELLDIHGIHDFGCHHLNNDNITESDDLQIKIEKLVEIGATDGIILSSNTDILELLDTLINQKNHDDIEAILLQLLSKIECHIQKLLTSSADITEPNLGQSYCRQGVIQLILATEIDDNPIKMPTILNSFTLAGQYNCPTGYYNLGVILFYGINDHPTDHQAAMDSIQMAANFNHTASLSWLAIILQSQLQFNRRDNRQALQYWLKTEGQFNSHARFASLAMHYTYGLGGLKQNFDKAREYYELAIVTDKLNKANPLIQRCCYNLGVMFIDGIGVQRDYLVGARYLAIGIKKNDPLSAIELGCIYEKGLGVHKDYDLAANMQTLAITLMGQNSTKDYDSLGLAYYRLAKAMSKLNRDSETEIDLIQQNYLASYNNFIQGSSHSLKRFYFIGKILERGYGQDQNQTLARHYYQLAGSLDNILVDDLRTRRYAFKAKIRLHALKFTPDVKSPVATNLQSEESIIIPGHIQQLRTESLNDDDNDAEVTMHSQKLYEKIKSSFIQVDHKIFPRLQYQLYRGMQIDNINDEMVSIDQKREELEAKLDIIEDQMDDDQSGANDKEYIKLKQSLEVLDKQYEEKRIEMKIINILFSIKLTLFYYIIYNKLMEVWLSCRLLANGKANVVAGTFQMMKLFRKTLHIYPIKVASNILKLNLRWYSLTLDMTINQSNKIQMDNDTHIIAEMDTISEFIARQSTIRYQSTILSSLSSENVYRYADKIMSQIVKELSENHIPKEGETLATWLLNSIQI